MSLTLPAPVYILDVPFSPLNMDETCAQCLAWMREGQFHQIVTANPEAVMYAQSHPDYHALLRRADLVTPDGIGAVIASRWYGQPLRERVGGFDLVEAVFSRASPGTRVYVLGASPESIAKGLANVRRRFPHVVFKGRDGYFSEAEIEAIVTEIIRFEPHLVLVGTGMPRQEFFIAGHGPRFGTLCIGIGGSIDGWAGIVKRAPKIWRKLGIEWLYRLLRQPSRFRRQLALPKFAWYAWRDARRRKK